jgi:hypothetical protein
MSYGMKGQLNNIHINLPIYPFYFLSLLLQWLFYPSHLFGYLLPIFSFTPCLFSLKAFHVRENFKGSCLEILEIESLKVATKPEFYEQL